MPDFRHALILQHLQELQIGHPPGFLLCEQQKNKPNDIDKNKNQQNRNEQRQKYKPTKIKNYRKIVWSKDT